MFTETYQEITAIGSDSGWMETREVIPYRKMTEEEVYLWKWYLPRDTSLAYDFGGYRTELEWLRGYHLQGRFGNDDAAEAIKKAWRAKHFDRMDIWMEGCGDPIAVGVIVDRRTAREDCYFIHAWSGAEKISLRELRWYYTYGLARLGSQLWRRPTVPRAAYGAIVAAVTFFVFRAIGAF